jgi:AcrR family transcriptional regulator
VPKVVDREERRKLIVAATWRLIAARGIDGANMRDIATEAGYTNGALSHYFAGKDDILRTAFEHVYQATNQRMSAALGDARGIEALRRFCCEVMPINDEQLLEARIATALWQHAMYDAHMAESNQRAMDLWRKQLAGFLDQAKAQKAVGDVDTRLVAEQLLNMMMGMQILGVLTPEDTSADRQLEMLDKFIAALRPMREVDR